MTNPIVPLNGFKVYLGPYLETFRELTISVRALREVCAEKVEGFDKAYVARCKDLKEHGGDDLPTAGGLGQILRDFDQLTVAIQELYDAGKLKKH
jgi:hypothetical protein